MGNKVKILYRQAGSEDVLEAEGRSFAKIHRVVLKGHPTDTFVIEIPLHNKTLYPSFHAATHGAPIAVAPDFATLAGILSQIGQAMCFDEPAKVEGLLGVDGEPVGCIVVQVQVGPYKVRVDDSPRSEDPTLAADHDSAVGILGDREDGTPEGEQEQGIRDQVEPPPDPTRRPFIRTHRIGCVGARDHEGSCYFVLGPRT